MSNPYAKDPNKPRRRGERYAGLTKAEIIQLLETNVCRVVLKVPGPGNVHHRIRASLQEKFLPTGRQMPNKGAANRVAVWNMDEKASNYILLNRIEYIEVWSDNTP